MHLLAQQTLFHVVVAHRTDRDVYTRVRLLAEVEHDVHSLHGAQVGDLVSCTVVELKGKALNGRNFEAFLWRTKEDTAG